MTEGRSTEGTSTGTQTILYTHQDSKHRQTSINAGQMNGNFAAWDRYVFSGDFKTRCDIWTYDVAAGTTTRLANPDGKCQSGPAVSADGTLYFHQSGLSCGLHAKMITLPPGGSESVVYRLPKGHDYAGAYAVDNPDGSSDVYFDPGSCVGKDHGDIVKLPGV